MSNWAAVTDAIVIGAGIAGVTAARELQRAGRSAVVVEARDRIGGRVYSVRDFCGDPVEGGAEFVHGVRASTWPEVRAAGLAVRPCPSVRDTMLSLGGRARWLPRTLLHPGLWPTFTILRAVAKLGPPDVPAREFIDRRGYTGRARVLAEMVLTAHLPGSIDEVGVQGLVADGVLTLEQGLNHRVVEGYDAVVAFIAGGLDIRLGFPVQRISWDNGGVIVRAADGRELSARAAVCTLPVGVLKSRAVQFVPELPQTKQSALTQMEMGPVGKLLLHFREAFWPRWLALLACGTGPVTLYWPVFYGAEHKPPVLIAYYTGPRAGRLAAASEDEAVATALADLSLHFPGTNPRQQLLAHRRIDWTTDPFSRGGYTFLRPGGIGARERLAAADTGRLFFAGSATESRPIAATVEAAYCSGKRAAQDVCAALGGSTTRNATSATAVSPTPS